MLWCNSFLCISAVSETSPTVFVHISTEHKGVNLSHNGWLCCSGILACVSADCGSNFAIVNRIQHTLLASSCLGPIMLVFAVNGPFCKPPLRAQPLECDCPIMSLFVISVITACDTIHNPLLQPNWGQIYIICLMMIVVYISVYVDHNFLFSDWLVGRELFTSLIGLSVCRNKCKKWQLFSSIS